MTLKPVPFLPFADQGSLGVKPNQLMLTLQPDEGVSVSLQGRIPGPRMILRPVRMEFLYGTTFLSRAGMDAPRGPRAGTRAESASE